MTPTNGEAVLNVKRIVPSGGGNLWVEANGRMRRCAGRQWLAESDGWNRELGRWTSLHFVHGDSEGGLWAGAGDLGLIHVAADGTFQRLTTRDGLPSNVVHFAYEDHDGNIWTGYERGGLVQVRRRLFRVIGKEQGLGDSLINTVCEDAQGAVWIGTHSGIVGRYENGVCTNIVLQGSARTQDSCVVADARGRVWIGAQGIGLLMSERRTVAAHRHGDATARVIRVCCCRAVMAASGSEPFGPSSASRMGILPLNTPRKPQAVTRRRWRKRQMARFGRERWTVFSCTGTANNLSRLRRRTGIRWDESGRCGRRPTAACGRERRKAVCCIGATANFSDTR